MSNQHRAKGFNLIFTSFALILIAGAAVWLFVGRSSAVESINTFEVARRSFSVVLKEKGELEAAKSTMVQNEVEGRATIIWLIPEGTMAQKGDPLVELASNEIQDKITSEELRETTALASYEASEKELAIQIDKNESDIRKANLAVELDDLALKKYLLGDRPQQQQDAEIAIEQARTTLQRLQEDLEVSNKLFKPNKYISLVQLKEDQFNVTKAEWDLQKAEKAFEVMKKYTFITDERQAESNVEESKKELGRTIKSAEAELAKSTANRDAKKKELELVQTKLAQLRRQLEKCKIQAPDSGLVVYYSGGGGRFGSEEDQIKEGADVRERQVLMTLVNTGSMNVKLRVHESKTGKIQIGQPARVHVEGLAGREFSGSVKRIGVLAESQGRWLNPDLKEYEVIVALDQPDPSLKPGVTAVADILVQHIDDSLAIPPQAVFSKAGHNFVFKSAGRDYDPVEIEIGAAGIEWVEVKEGLAEGDKVILAANDDLMRRLPDLPPVRSQGGWSGEGMIGAPGNIAAQRPAGVGMSGRPGQGPPQPGQGMQHPPGQGGPPRGAKGPPGGGQVATTGESGGTTSDAHVAQKSAAAGRDSQAAGDQSH